MTRPLTALALCAAVGACAAFAPTASADDDYFDDLEDYYEDLEDAREDYYEDRNRYLRRSVRRGYYAAPRVYSAPRVYHAPPVYYGGYGRTYHYGTPVYPNYGYGGGYYGNRYYGGSGRGFGLSAGRFNLYIR